MKKIIYILLLSCAFFACSNNSTLPELDLMSKGIPLKLKAPEDAVVTSKDMGVFKDVTIKSGDDFYIQITGGQKFQNDEKARKEEELNATKRLVNFSRVVQEDDNGFLYEKKRGDDLSYDFRRIRIQGEEEYVFQCGLIGIFTLEAAQKMFEATARD